MPALRFSCATSSLHLFPNSAQVHEFLKNHHRIDFQGLSDMVYLDSGKSD